MTRPNPNRRFWLLAMVVLAAFVVLVELVKVPGFWTSYVKDIVGPAYIYILVRGLIADRRPTRLGRIFTPEVALVTVLSIFFLGELAQYFRLYDAHYDPYDLLAYVSLVVPAYAVDKRQGAVDRG